MKSPWALATGMVAVLALIIAGNVSGPVGLVLLMAGSALIGILAAEAVDEPNGVKTP